MIANTALLLADFQFAHSNAVLNVKIVKASFWKDCNTKREVLGLTNAKDREAYIQSIPQVIEAQKEEIHYGYLVNQLQVIVEKYENIYISARKLANLLDTYNNAQDNYVKYNREQGENL